MRRAQVNIVIPAYNEGRRLPDYLPRLCEALAKSSLPWRITIVDDGSREDDSHKITSGLYDVRRIYEQNIVRLKSFE